MSELPPHEMVWVADFDLPEEPWLKEFNDWYSGRHAEDVLNTPGVVATERYAWRRADGRVRLLMLIFHSGTPSVQETLASPGWARTRGDFVATWRDRVGEPEWQIYRRLGVGGDYRGWLPRDEALTAQFG